MKSLKNEIVIDRVEVNNKWGYGSKNKVIIDRVIIQGEQLTCLHSAICIQVSSKAKLYEIGTKEYWIPCSQIKESPDIGRMGKLVITDWIAIQKGFIEEPEDPDDPDDQGWLNNYNIFHNQ